jgi:hypothetical protein
MTDAEKRRFTAYRIYDDQSTSGHVRNLTLADARDATRFPQCPQQDQRGRTYSWRFSINGGSTEPGGVIGNAPSTEAG